MTLGEGDLAALRFPHATPPPEGDATEVAPGVRWLRMPLPFALNHINLWLVDDGAGWAIVDTGINSQQTKDLWERLFVTALDGRPVTRLICTHFHPDHMGLAGWITERLGVELWTTAGEWQHAQQALADKPGTFNSELTEFYRHIGYSNVEETVRSSRPNSYRHLVGSVPNRYHRLADGMGLQHRPAAVARDHRPGSCA
jgi:glyoxylase-like metal-dependent hydrolase (beta-lactamase superfamily II)